MELEKVKRKTNILTFNLYIYSTKFFMPIFKLIFLLLCLIGIKPWAHKIAILKKFTKINKSKTLIISIPLAL
jgi:hypothetical protein